MLLRLLSALLFASSASQAMAPLAWFYPQPSWADSFSQRRTLPFYPGEPSRLDMFVRSRSVDGKPLLIEIRETGNAVEDSGAIRLTWDFSLPTGIPSPYAGASKIIQTSFLHGALVSSKTTTTSWDPATRTMVHFQSPADTGCPWADSSTFDSQGRILSEMDCSEGWLSSTGSDARVPFFELYRAVFEAPADTIPRCSTLRDLTDTLGGGLVDSICTRGPANRPDSLVGSENEVLVRDSSGRLLATRFFGASTGSTTYAYDPSGRLTLEAQQSGSTSDTLWYVYSWSNNTGIHRPTTSPGPQVRLIRQGLEIDLPASDLVGLEVLLMDGKRQNLRSPLSLPAGRSVVPIPTRPGDLVRIATSAGNSTLRAPVR